MKPCLQQLSFKLVIARHAQVGDCSTCLRCPDLFAKSCARPPDRTGSEADHSKRSKATSYLATTGPAGIADKRGYLKILQVKCFVSLYTTSQVHVGCALD